MSNPFDILNGNSATEDPGEQWGGSFQCQLRGCYQIVSIADYDSKARRLTWRCPDGHDNVVNDIE